MTLEQLHVGQRGTVLSVDGEERLKYRLYDLGLLPGTEITMQGIAPAGDPLEIFLRGYTLSVRVSHARKIRIKEEADSC